MTANNLLPGVLPGSPEAPGYLTIYDQERVFAGCVYVDEAGAILCPDGVLRDRQRFDVFRGGFEFQMQPDGSRSTRSAWEAFTLNRCKHFPKVLRRTYRTGLPFGVICDDGEAVNVFFPPRVKVSEGPVDPFLGFLQRMLPDQRDRNILLNWSATIVQNPGKKLQWAVVLQGTEGNGKTLFLHFLAHAVGMNVTHFPNPEELNEKFNTYLEGNLLIGVEEIHMEGRRDMLDRLKKYITNARIEVRAMRENKRMTDNLTNWLFLTNYQDAVVKSRNDRRYAIFFTAQQTADDLVRDGMDGRYFPDLWDWARGGGFAAVAGWLRRFNVVAEFDPLGVCHRAPETSSTGAAITASMGSLEAELLDAIEAERVGFRGDWVSSSLARKFLKEVTGKDCPTKLFKTVMRNLGFTEWGRAPRSFSLEGSRPVIYCKPKNKALDFSIYLVAQGYRSGNVLGFPQLPGVIVEGP